MPPIAGYLISYRFLSLFPKDNSGIHGLLPDFYGGNSFYAVPKRSPHPSNCYYTVTTSYNTFPYL